MLSFVRSSLLLAVLLFIAACSNTENEQDAIAKLSIKTVEEIAALLSEERFDEVTNLVKRKERDGLATSADQILAAKAYLSKFDAIGAEVALERIPEEEREQDDYVLLTVRVDLLEGRLYDVEEKLNEHTFTGDALYEAKLLLGDVLFLQRKPEEALNEFTQAIAVGPDYLPAYISRAQIYLNLGQIPEAEADARKAVEINPEDSIAHYTLGNAFKRLGREDEAKQEFINALTYFPENVAAMIELANISIVKNNLETAETYLDGIYAISPENNTARLFSAMILVLKGSDETAKEQLLLLASTSPKNPQIDRLLGHVAYRLKDNQLAREKLEDALSYAPFDRPTRIALGDIYTAAGEPSLALNVLSPMLQDDSNDFMALSIGSVAAAQSKDFDKAVEYTARTIELAENPEESLDEEIVAQGIDGSAVRVLNRKLATYYFEYDKPDEAYEVLKKLTDSNKDDVTSAILLLNMQVEGGELDDAMKSADTLVDTAPNSPVGYNARGTVHYRQGNLTEALTAYNSALEINSGYISALKNRGTLLLRQENYPAAMDDLNAVLEKTPYDAHAQLMLARCLLETGDAASAVNYYRDLTGVFANSPSYHIQYARSLATLGDHSRAVDKLLQAKDLVNKDNVGLALYVENLLSESDAVLVAEAEKKAQQIKEKAEAEEKKDTEDLALQEELKKQFLSDKEVDEAQAKREAENRALQEELRKKILEDKAAAEAEDRALQEKLLKQLLEDEAAEEAEKKAEEAKRKAEEEAKNKAKDEEKPKEEDKPEGKEKPEGDDTPLGDGRSAA